jgi:hypothetical protein
MKIYIVFHEADPFALDGVGDDDGGLSLNPLCLIECGY